MEFTLYYEGMLKSNCKPVDKHKMRKIFHKQLMQLWDQHPLKGFKDLASVQKDKDKFSLCLQVGDFNFVPRVSAQMSSIAELDITILQPDRIGILNNKGDIDNRMKSLLDSLKVPHEPNALPKSVTPDEDENPFYCLLEDDSLVTRLNVRTEQWLGKANDSKEVLAIIHVTTKLTYIGIGNLGFA